MVGPFDAQDWRAQWHDRLQASSIASRGRLEDERRYIEYQFHPIPHSVLPTCNTSHKHETHRWDICGQQLPPKLKGKGAILTRLSVFRSIKTQLDLGPNTF